MDALTFLYWALGIGFLVLVFFMSLALIYVIKILKDVSEATTSVKDTAETMNENVTRIADKVADTTDQITEYIVKPIALTQYLMEKIKPFVDMVQKSSEYEDDFEKPKNKKKGVFSKRKK
jgi:uncharacterized protein YoxC